MIEDEIYRTSSQFRLWSYTEPSLQELRSKTNTIAGERVRAALRRAREAHQSTSSSANGTPQTGSDGEAKKQDDKEIDCLTPEEELAFVRFYCEKTLELGETYKPPLPTMVRATAIQYLKRFYLTNSPMNYHPKSIMACALFLATKTDNYYMSLRQFANGIPGKKPTSPDEVIAPEFVLMQGLRFTFDVRHPFRGLEGGVMELQAIADGQGQPGPHLTHQTAHQLQQRLLAIPPGPVRSSSISDRIGRAHGTTRETLKSAAQMTDAYFLYTPSQIWLSAFLLADRPLAEFYLDTKLGGPLTTTDVKPDPADLQNPLYDLRTKLLKVLMDCSALLQAYQPLSSDEGQMADLQRIARKHHLCLNPEKKLGVKRIPAGAAASPAPASESETERLAKKRKLEAQKAAANDMFGPELVTERTK